jgi:hypothetical protein
MSSNLLPTPTWAQRFGLISESLLSGFIILYLSKSICFKKYMPLPILAFVPLLWLLPLA